MLLWDIELYKNFWKMAFTLRQPAYYLSVYMELTQPRLAIFNYFIVIQVFTLANGSRTGHSPNYYSYNITTGLAWFFNLCETVTLRQAWACWNKAAKQKTIFTQANLKVMPSRNTN